MTAIQSPLTPRIRSGSVSMRESAEAAARSIASITANVKQLESVAEKDSFQAKITPKNLSSSLTYSGILNGADLEYIVAESSLKENIIVKAKAAEYVYEFTLDAGGLTPELTSSGSIELKDGSGTAVFVIPAGYMIDADGESSMEVEYTLSSAADGKYILTVSADADWMNDTKRAFPVTIDPLCIFRAFTTSRPVPSSATLPMTSAVRELPKPSVITPQTAATAVLWFE